MNSRLPTKTYAVEIKKDSVDGGYTATCNELNAFSQAETYEGMIENIKEAVELASDVTGKDKHVSLEIIGDVKRS